MDRARKQVEGGRGDTVTVAKAVQDYQARLRDTNRKIMALIAEVSMFQVRCGEREEGGGRENGEGGTEER